MFKGKVDLVTLSVGRLDGRWVCHYFQKRREITFRAPLDSLVYNYIYFKEEKNVADDEETGKRRRKN